MGSQPKLEFFEKVRISTQNPEKTSIDGGLGAVLGRAQNESGSWVYSVHVYAAGESWFLEEGELQSTGEFDDAGNFYDGSNIRVPADNENSEPPEQ